MGLKKNLPFAIAIAVIGVVFVAAAVVVQRSYAGLNKAKQEDQETQKILGDLEKQVPNAEHREYAETQLGKTEQEFEKLKQTLLAWWDSSIYEEDRTPGIFQGNLMELRRRIMLFAASQKPAVALDEAVTYMGFNEFMTGTAPTEVTLDMLRQQSVMRDIILLLIQENVYSINSITWKGLEKGGSLYDKYVVSLSFTCRYPQLAKFQANLVKKSKTRVVLRGERGERADSYELPRNYLVIEQLSYAAEDQKIARLGSTGTDTTPGTTTPPGSNWPGSGGRPRTPDSSHDMTRTGSMRPPDSRTTPSNPYTSRMQPSGGQDSRPEQPKEGREPQYNRLNVTMTISMVDFSEAIRGKLPDENEQKTAGASQPTRPNQ